MAVNDQTTAIIGARVIDGLGRDPIEKGTLVIEGGRISAVGKDTAVQVTHCAYVIDAAGRTVLPGIIDCHVHSTYRARDIRQHLTNTPTYNVLRSTHILEETLACGVTTARDMGGADAGFREAIAEGFIKGPRLLISIVMISQTGGHGDCWVPAGIRLQKRAWLPSGVVDGPEEMRKMVRTLLMAGADFIKICPTGGITSLTDSWDEPQLAPEEIRTDQSHRLLVGENLVELEYMVKWLGMSEMDAIVAAASRAAECIERPELGALAPGRIADVLMVDGDPLENIRVLQQRDRLHLVMKEGKPYRHLPD